MPQTSRQSRVLVAAASVLLLASVAAAGPKPVQGKRNAIVKKQPNGTVDLAAVAAATSYKSREDYHAEIGPDPCRRAKLYAEHYELVVVAAQPGGILKGQIESGTSQVKFTLEGEGELEGFTHEIDLPANFEVHSAPHSAQGDGRPFDTNMYRIQGEGGGDDVFEYVRLVGGTANGYPSSGQMTLSSVRGNQVVVDSFFNIGFRIEFRGADGGPFAGLEGSIEGAVIMRSQPADATTDPTR